MFLNNQKSRTSEMTGQKKGTMYGHILHILWSIFHISSETSPNNLDSVMLDDVFVVDLASDGYKPTTYESI